MATFSPGRTDELCDVIASAASEGRKLEIRAGGSKIDIGVANCDADVLDMSKFVGVVDYDAPELVVTVKAATPLSEVVDLLATRGQCLAFDPYDHGPLFGRLPGSSTIGGIVAAGVSGSRRISGGSARDHLLGFSGVSGRGEAFVGGGKVVKNVTGYDVSKLVTGSWGRLAALTELTLKVMPRPPETATRLCYGLTPLEAGRVMSSVMGTGVGVTAAAHLPGHLRNGTAVTAFRIDGVGPSVGARLGLLDTVSDGNARGVNATPEEAKEFWDEISTLAPLQDDQTLWRVMVPPRECPGLFAAARAGGAKGLIDWAGGLVWLTTGSGSFDVRQNAAQAGGHAMLVRAALDVRASMPAFHPQPRPLAALEARVRAAFDPKGVFETGRFGDVVHAH